MMSVIDNYTLFFNFIDQYLPRGFNDIDRSDQLIRRLEEMTEANNQFFCLFDLIQLKFLYASNRSVEMLGVPPEDLSPALFIKLMHSDDLIWHNIAQNKLFSLGQQIFIEKTGSSLISTNFRLRISSGAYINFLVQYYLFFTDTPYKTVFALQILTDLSRIDRVDPGYHFYMGNDPYFFRYPDEKLLMNGNVFSGK